MSIVKNVPKWNNEAMKNFGEALKAFRENKNWSQKQLALEINVTPATISRWENGDRTPSLDALHQIVVLLQTTVAYLMGETDDPHQNIPVAKALSSNILAGARLDHVKSADNIIRVPLYGKELASCCGGGFPDIDQIYAEAEVFISMPLGFLGPISTDPNYQPFIIYAEGDSMVNAGIHHGAQVIINPYNNVLDGDAALVEFSTNPVTKNIAIKRVYWIDRCAVELRSACGDGWKRTFTKDDFDEKAVRIIGKVEWVGSKPKRG